MPYELDLPRLAEILAMSGQVRALDRPDAPENWVLAHALLDIADSCREIVDRHMPTLLNAPDEEAIEGCLVELRVDLEHILYHVLSCESLRDAQPREDTLPERS